MCTIITLSRELYEQDPNEVIDRIHADAKYNGHGFALLTVGKTASDVALVKSLDVEMLITILKHDTTWKRFWLHTRWSTGTRSGMSGVHGFTARNSGSDWYVFHNGSFQHAEAKKFAVDSEWAADLVSRYGVEAARTVIDTNATFANIFWVNPTEGKWHLLRKSNGSLHTTLDQQDYSTNEIKGLITIPVPNDTKADFTFELEKAPTVSRGSIYGGAATNYSTHKSWYNKTWNGVPAATKKIVNIDKFSELDYEDWTESKIDEFLNELT